MKLNLIRGRSSNIFLIVSYYISKIEELQIKIRDKTQNFERLKAQRNELNNKVKTIREELVQLHEPGSYIGEVVKPMGQTKVLVKVNPDGKYVVDVEKDIDINKCTPNTRVALRADSYSIHKILPTKVDPLVSLMKVSSTISPDVFNLKITATLLLILGRESA
jgi:26S proteasome regulatory subunit T6